MAGQLDIQRSDFELEFPQQVGLRVSDDAKIEVELTFVHKGETAEAPTTTGESDDEEPRVRREPRRRASRLLVSMREEDGDTIAVYSVNVDGSISPGWSSRSGVGVTQAPT